MPRKPAISFPAFLPEDRKLESWESLRPFFDELLRRPISSLNDLMRWMNDRSTLNAWLEEDLAWRYIRMNCDTSVKDHADRYALFVTEIEPRVKHSSFLSDRKLVESPLTASLRTPAYEILIRSARMRINLFREENLPLIAELQVAEQEYGKVISEITVHYGGKEYTLPQASLFLRDPDRRLREEVYRLMQKERISLADRLQKLFTDLVQRRHKIAVNAGYLNYRDYRFDDLGRFDYGPDDCMRFHESVSREVVPLVDHIMEQRKNKMGVDRLRSWDLEADPEGKPPVKPFSGAGELLEKAIKCFNRVDPRYGAFLKKMADRGFLDLESRKGKAPGGFNYPLYESNVPFIFMNASGSLRDLETMVHEGGHAIHSFLSGGLPLMEFKVLPAEVAELASMAMELVTMEHWDVFFDNADELRRARIHQMEGILQVLPWVAAIDQFQHWVYTATGHGEHERLAEWTRIYKRFGSKHIDWSGLEEHFVYAWQKQLHLFELPFYYIEYGIAQLGAIAIWKNYRADPAGTLKRFEAALSLGYSAPIPRIYRAAGIRFDFSPGYLKELMEFVWMELQKLYAS